MHTHGEQFANIPAEQTFAGQSLPRHAATIEALVAAHEARSILDYGSGKGEQYKPMRIKTATGKEFPSIPAFWGVDLVTCFDPGYEPFSQLPQGKFDGVISTDVLEHCPEDDVPWIVSEMFSFARKFVYANVACYPAKKRLSTGENAHCTVRPMTWWSDVLKDVAPRYPGVYYRFALDRHVQTEGGVRVITDMLAGIG
jgi:hypothetical protein